MTTEVVGTVERLRTYRPPVIWIMAGLVGLLLLYLVAGRVERMIARWPQTSQAGVSPNHCAEFIELAKATYGDVWKARLDPDDKTCAAEIQQAWEQQRTSREAADLAAQSAEPVMAPAPPPAAPVTEAPRARAETYCLNVISLAKAKHGADWVSKLEPAERAACAQP